jgi:hypothetical protein
MPLRNVESFWDSDANAGGQSYVDTIRPDEIFKDRRALNDIEEYFAAKGETHDSQESMIRDWFSDMRWQEANSFSAIKSYAQATDATPAEKDRLARLTRLWERVPDFSKEGGGVSGAIGSYALAAIADPINLIPLPGVNKGLGVAAAQAAKKGANIAAKGALHGAKRNAIAEGVAGGLSEGIIGVAQEAKEADIGHSEFSLANVLGRVALGGIGGATLGGAIGAASGAIGAPKAAARAFGLANDGGATRAERIASVERGARISNLEDNVADAEFQLAEMQKNAQPEPKAGVLAMRTEERAAQRAGELSTLVRRRADITKQISELKAEVKSARADGLGHEMYAENERHLKNFQAERDVHDRLDTIDRAIEAKSETPQLREQRAELYAIAREADADPEYETASRLNEFKEKWSKQNEVAPRQVAPEAQAAPAEQPTPEQPAPGEQGQAVEAEAAGAPAPEEVDPKALLAKIVADNPGLPEDAKARLAELSEIAPDFVERVAGPQPGAPGREYGRTSYQPDMASLADVDRKYHQFLADNVPEVDPPEKIQETILAERKAAETPAAPEPEGEQPRPAFKSPEAEKVYDDAIAEGVITPEDIPEIAPNGTVVVRKIRSVADQRRKAAKEGMRSETATRQASQQEAQNAAKAKADAASKIAENSEARLGATPEQVDARVAEQANMALQSRFARSLIGRIPDEGMRKRVYSAVIKASRLANGQAPGGTDKLLRELQLFNESALADMSDVDRQSVMAMADTFKGEREIAVARANIIHLAGKVAPPAAKDGPIGADGIYRTWDDLYQNLPADADQPTGFRAEMDVTDQSGGVIVRAGEVGWWDPMTERVYASFEQAKAMREGQGIAPVADPEKALASDGAVVTEARLDAEATDVSDAAGRAEDAAKAAALERMSIEVPDGRVLAITNGKQIRILKPDQAAAGKGVKDLLGKADPRDWRVGHVPEDTVRDRANALAAFETPEDYALRVPAPRLKAEDALRVRLTAADIEVLAPAGVDTMSIRTLMDLDNYLAHLEATSWEQVDNLGEVDALLGQMEAGLQVMARHAPSGLVRPVQDRKLAVEQLRMILEGSDPDVIEEAARSLELMGGEDAPIFTDVYWGKGKVPSGAANVNADPRIPYANQIFIGADNARVTQQGNLAGKLATHYHEMAHWAHRNVLTPEDRLEFWKYVRKNFYDAMGFLDPDAVKKRLPPGTKFGSGIGGSPGEMFAEQFVAWVTSRDKSAVLGNPSFWNRVKRYVQQIYSWFVNRKSVDPQLEPLFSKILPDESERIRAAAGGTVSLESLPKVASHAVRRAIELDQISEGISLAMASDTDAGLIEASRQLLGHLFSLNPKYTSKTRGDVNLKPFGPVWAAKVDIRNLRDKLSAVFAEKGNQRVVANGPDATKHDAFMERARGIFEVVREGLTGKRPNWKQVVMDEANDMALPDSIMGNIREAMQAVESSDGKGLAASMRAFLDDADAYGRVIFSNDDELSIAEQFRFENIDGTSEVDGEALSIALREFFETETADLARGGGLQGLFGDLRALYRQTLLDVGGPGAAKLPKIPQSISGAKALSELDPAGGLMKRHRSHYRQPAWAAGKEGLVNTAIGQVNVKHRSDGRALSADKGLRDASDAALMQQYERSVADGEHRNADIIAAVIMQRYKAMAEDPGFDEVFTRLPDRMKEQARSLTVNNFESALLDALAAGQADYARAIVGEFKRKPKRWASLDKRIPVVEFKDETVNAAKVAELSRMQRPNLDDGIPGGAPAGYQDVLRMLTSRRNGQTEITMRTMGHRLLMLNEAPNEAGLVTEANVATLTGADYGPGVVTGFRSPAFQRFRGDLLEANVGLNFDGDADKGLRTITEMVMRTRSLSPADKAAASERGMDEVMAFMRGEIGSRGLPEAVSGAYERIAERVAYVTNGQIGKADVLGRYPRLGMYGDALRGTPALPSAVRADNMVSAGTEGRLQASLHSLMTEDRLAVVRGFVGNGVGVDSAGTPVVWYRHGNRLARAITQLGETVPDDPDWGPMIVRQREIARMARDDGAATAAMQALENMNIAAREAGVEFLDGATPTYVGLRATLDLRPTAVYRADSAQVNAIVGALSRITGKPISGVEGRGSAVLDALRAQASDAQVRRAIEAAGFDSYRTGDVIEILDPGRDKVKPVWFSEFTEATPEPTERIPGEGRLSGSAITIASLSPDDVFDEAVDNVIHHVGSVADFQDNTVVSAIARTLKGKEVRPEDLVEVRNASKATMLMGSGAKRLRQDGANFLGEFVEGYFPAVHQTFAEYFLPIQGALNELDPSQSAVRRALIKYTSNVVKPLVTRPKQPESHARILKALRRGTDSSEYRALSPEERKAYRVIAERRGAILDELRESGVMVGNTKNYVPQVYDVSSIQKDSEGFVGALKQYFKDEWLMDGTISEKTNPDGEAEGLARSIMSGLIADDGVYIPGAGRRHKADDSHLAYQRLIRLQDNPEVLRRMEAGNFLMDDLEGLWIKYYDQAARKITEAKTIGATGHGYDDYLHVAQRGVDGIKDMLTKSESYRGFSGETGESTRISAPMPFSHDPTGLDATIDELIAQTQSGGAKAGFDYLMSLIDTDRLQRAGQVAYETRMRAVANAVADMRITRESAQHLSQSGYVHAEGVLAHVQGRSISNASEEFKKFSRGVRALNNVSLLSFTTLTSMSDVVLPLIRSGDFQSWLKGLYKYASDPAYRRQIKNTGVAVENILHQRMQGMFSGDVRGMPGRIQQAFFAGTLLTPWTDMNRAMTGAVGLEAMDAQVKIAARTYKEGVAPQNQPPAWKRAKRILNSYGLGDYAMPSKFAKSLDVTDPQVAEAMIRFANDTVFSPNPGDMPLWSQTPAGAILAQLKTFPIMMQRMAFGTEGSGGVFRNAFRAGRGFLADHSGGMFKAKPGDDAYTIKDALPAAYMLTAGPLFGSLVLGSKDLAQGRGEEWGETRTRNLSKTFIGDIAGLDESDSDDLYGWYIESMMALGGMGMLAEVMQDLAANADNGSFGLNRSMSALFGPSVGLSMDVLKVGGGGLKGAARMFGAEEANTEERAAVRALAARVPIFGGIRPARDTAVDVIAGEAQNKGNGGGSSDLGFGGVGFGDVGFGDLTF